LVKISIMKTLLLLLLPLLILNNCLAQQVNGYEGPAKIAVTQLKDGITKLEKSVAAGGSNLDADTYLSLVRKLADVKKKDPSFNISEIESKLKTLEASILGNKQKAVTARQDMQDQANQMQKAGTLLNSLFYISPGVDNGDLPTIEEKLKVYNQKLDELLTMDLSVVKPSLQVHYKRIIRPAQVAEKELNEIDRSCREQTDPKNAEREYYELIYFRDFWNAAQKVFPEEPAFKNAYAHSVKLLSGLGSKENVHSLAAKTMENKVRSAHLPAAVMKDATLEKTFMDIFNSNEGQQIGATAVKAVLIHDDWTIIRNELSGIVTGRRRAAAIAYRKKDGKCYFFSSFYILQEYVGGTFGRSMSANLVSGGNELLCENVK
jgi:hypothetical protein